MTRLITVCPDVVSLCLTLCVSPPVTGNFINASARPRACPCCWCSNQGSFHHYNITQCKCNSTAVDFNEGVDEDCEWLSVLHLSTHLCLLLLSGSALLLAVQSSIHPHIHLLPLGVVQQFCAY